MATNSPRPDDCTIGMTVFIKVYWQCETFLLRFGKNKYHSSYVFYLAQRLAECRYYVCLNGLKSTYQEPGELVNMLHLVNLKAKDRDFITKGRSKANKQTNKNFITLKALCKAVTQGHS